MHTLAYKTSGRLPTFVLCKFTHQTLMASLSHHTNIALQTVSKFVFVLVLLIRGLNQIKLGFSLPVSA